MYRYLLSILTVIPLWLFGQQVYPKYPSSKIIATVEAGEFLPKKGILIGLYVDDNNNFYAVATKSIFSATRYLYKADEKLHLTGKPKVLKNIEYKGGMFYPGSYMFGSNGKMYFTGMVKFLKEKKMLHVIAALDVETGEVNVVTELAEEPYRHNKLKTKFEFKYHFNYHYSNNKEYVAVVRTEGEKTEDKKNYIVTIDVTVYDADFKKLYGHEFTYIMEESLYSRYYPSFFYRNYKLSRWVVEMPLIITDNAEVLILTYNNELIRMFDQDVTKQKIIYDLKATDDVTYYLSSRKIAIVDDKEVLIAVIKEYSAVQKAKITNKILCNIYKDGKLQSSEVHRIADNLIQQTLSDKELKKINAKKDKRAAKAKEDESTEIGLSNLKVRDIYYDASHNEIKVVTELASIVEEVTTTTNSNGETTTQVYYKHMFNDLFVFNFNEQAEWIWTAHIPKKYERTGSVPDYNLMGTLTYMKPDGELFILYGDKLHTPGNLKSGQINCTYVSEEGVKTNYWILRNERKMHSIFLDNYSSKFLSDHELFFHIKAKNLPSYILMEF